LSDWMKTGYSMSGFLRKSLGNKITLAIILTIIVIMSAEIYVRIYFGTRDRIELMTMLAKEVAASTYAGIKTPMWVGDKDGVKRTLMDIQERTKGVEVFICAFDQEITYSTDESKVGRMVEDSVQNKQALQTLSQILVSGVEPTRPFEDIVSGKRNLVSLHPIVNHPDCYHCHGSSRKVLGSMIIQVEAEKIYATVTAQRNRTILVTLCGLFLAVILIYFMINKLVRRPVEDLADKAKKFAEGDMSVSVNVKTDDEIGILGGTFNYMVESVSSFSKKLEEEVNRKTVLLNERTRLLTLLERANKDLRELDKLKSTFLANMSHELRTPMNAIIGYTDLLLDGVDGPVNEDQEKSLRKVATNARHLLQLINDVLDISKIEAGKMKLNPKEIDLKWLVESALPTFEPQMKLKGLRLVIDIPEGLPLIYGDEDRIREILINLLSNAVKFTQHGSITVSAKFSERGVRPGEPPIFMEICVEDTGIGIKEDDVGKIFDKFVQADLTTVRQYEGTGLGLSIARGLVSLHKGVIWATSKLGEGSKFCFTLPLKKEMLEKPAEPVIETRIAEAMGDYFEKPAAEFLKDPEFAGKPIRCWEYIRCGQPSCPAYGSKEARCWLIMGTHCTGMKIAAYPEKVDFCKGCELIQSIVAQPAEEMLLDEYRSTAAGKKTVLAIDDNIEAIDIMRKYLGDDYNVIGLLSGDRAVEKAKEIKPVAITLDIMMPKKDGWQVLRELKDDPETQDIPVIVLSIVDDQRMGFSLGAAEYIIKPVAKDVLLRKMKKLEKTAKIKRVLVVDNDANAVRSIGSVLEDAEYQVAAAYNSEDAIKAIGSFRPDLIVLNLMMPETGFDVIEYLKTDSAANGIPLIVLTQRDLTVKEIDDLNGRIHGILNKVVLSKEDLLRELRDTMDKMSGDK
jgi:signal transduction histidine kinase/DNA-binding response OmpR family regulator